jgi:DNA polymerase-1
MYLTPTQNHWACDIEADNLLDEATTIWCACVENCLTGEKETMIDGDGWRRWLAAHPEAILVGHNFLAYDLVMLNRFWGSRHPVRLVVDTFVLSQVYNPSYPRPAGMTGKKGPHSLEAWGVRLRHPKTEFHDFSARTKRMIRYCENDVSLTKKLFLKLAERMRATGFSESGLELEHLSWAIIQNKQRRNGFPFNYRAAHELYVTLIARQEELQNEIYKLWPPQFRVVASYKQARKKDGSYTKGYELHSGQFPKLVDRPDGGYDAYDWVAFNLGSPTQRIEKLLELGWQPVNFTKKTAKGGGGNPQVDEESLIAYAELSGNPEILALAKWIVCNARGNMIRTWLDAYNEKTGAIHGKLFIASTLRYRHRDPNSANIPAVREGKDADGNDYVLYGEAGAWAYECRDLWNCGNPDDWSLVGIDGTGIQNRCLINGLINTVGEDAVREFKELGLSGDIHKHNIRVLGLANKPAAKKFYYTLMMGGRGARLAADQVQFGTRMTAQEGNEKRERMIASIPGFQLLIDKLERERDKTGRIRLCDGTPILVPSPHMVIPYLLQGDESRLMKKALIYVDQEIRLKGLQEHCRKVADIHDEWQWQVRNQYVQQFIDIALPCFPRAGEFFNYKIVIEGDAKVGKTWAETH